MKTPPAPAPQGDDLPPGLRDLLHAQGLAVLSTQGEGQPYSSLVAFAVTADLGELLFATTRTTRKFRNLQGDPRVSLLVDNRSNRESDFQDAMAATAVGRAREVSGDEREQAVAVYLARHPYLEEFLVAPTCALLRVRVDAYTVVQRFQNVSLFHPAR